MEDISTALYQKRHNSILLNVQERQKRNNNPSHFNVFDLDKNVFSTDFQYFDLYKVFTHYEA